MAFSNRYRHHFKKTPVSVARPTERYRYRYLIAILKSAFSQWRSGSRFSGECGDLSPTKAWILKSEPVLRIRDVLSRIPEKIHFGSGSRIQEVKRHRIPDPDPQHWSERHFFLPICLLHLIDWLMVKQICSMFSLLGSIFNHTQKKQLTNPNYTKLDWNIHSTHFCKSDCLTQKVTVSLQNLAGILYLYKTSSQYGYSALHGTGTCLTTIKSPENKVVPIPIRSRLVLI
jgi:hypothetical protein